MLRNHLASFAPVTFLFASGCDSGGSSLSPAPTPTPSPAMGGSEATGAGAGSTNGEAPGNGNAAATLTERPSNSSCLAFAKPTENSDVKLERHFTAAGFPEITGCQQAPQNKRFYSVRRTGQINSFTKDDASDQSVFMDISGSINSGPGEGGLLGMAWHPTRKDDNSNAGFSLGLSIAQLNRKVGAEGSQVSQIDTFEKIDLFSKALPADKAQLPTPNASLEPALAARSYMEANCAFCHRPGGTGGGNLDLRYSASFKDTHPCDVTPGSGDLGIGEARVVAPQSSRTFHPSRTHQSSRGPADAAVGFKPSRH